MMSTGIIKIARVCISVPTVGAVAFSALLVADIREIAPIVIPVRRQKRFRLVFPFCCWGLALSRCGRVPGVLVAVFLLSVGVATFGAMLAACINKIAPIGVSVSSVCVVTFIAMLMAGISDIAPIGILGRP